MSDAPAQCPACAGDNPTCPACHPYTHDEEAQKRTKNGQLPRGDVVTIGALPHGMASKMPSIVIAVELSNGNRVYAQTSMKLFLEAASAFAAQFPDVLKSKTVFAVDDEGKATVLMVPEGYTGVIGIEPTPVKGDDEPVH